MPPDDSYPDSVGPSVAVPEPDAHGQAALLLAESILHALVENSTLSAAEAADIVQTAADVKRQVAAMIGESQGRMQASLDLLGAIRRSFETDAGVQPVIPLRPVDRE